MTTSLVTAKAPLRQSRGAPPVAWLRQVTEVVWVQGARGKARTMRGGGVPRARSHPDRLRGKSASTRDEAEGASTDEQRAQILAIVSHEMRTPLTSIISFSELLRGEAAGLSPEGQRFLGIIERNADRLLGLIDDLLMLNRIEAGGLPLELEHVSLPELASDAVKSATPVAATRKTSSPLSRSAAWPSQDPKVASPSSRLSTWQVLVQTAPAGASAIAPAAPLVVIARTPAHSVSAPRRKPTH